MKWTDAHRDQLTKIYGRLIRRFGFEVAQRHMTQGRLVRAAHARVEAA